MPSDDPTKKITIQSNGGRMTAREALVWAAGDTHGWCTVIIRGLPKDKTISFKCKCGITYMVQRKFKEALRNVPVDDKL